MLYLFILYQVFLVSPFVSAAGPFATSLLQTHNKFRALHGTAPLTWSPAIAANAIKVSKTCVFAHSKTPNNWGENIASGFATPRKAIETMYNSEKGMYPYGEPKWNSAWGHFTQILWRRATKLGCGQTMCPKLGGYFLVCEYDSGNVIGQFAANVCRPGGCKKAQQEVEVEEQFGKVVGRTFVV